eukprot:NODE_10472_length_334_cov_19.901754_g9560_i0.p4 GENE.NODE_10472_length_334_cov_19.901754_g9560_i0~~NODE_10472_length_334_cov_19.901754_g9560_i0.p4  ORF type:complete len:55 (+),score=7.90 NODE_10472_length_334_cov_19.901754_g9560_i0:141-305(+)
MSVGACGSPTGGRLGAMSPRGSRMGQFPRTTGAMAAAAMCRFAEGPPFHGRYPL